MVKAMDKVQFLNEQSEFAKAAMRCTIRDAKNDALRLLDPRGWVKSHPWKTVAAAAATGFLAANTIRRTPPASTPSKPEQPSRRSGMGRLLFRLFKEGLALGITFARPLVQEMLKAHAAAGNGAAPHEAPGQYPHQSPSSTPTDSPTWPSGR
jgi:hypothetical protein